MARPSAGFLALIGLVIFLVGLIDFLVGLDAFPGMVDVPVNVGLAVVGFVVMGFGAIVALWAAR